MKKVLKLTYGLSLTLLIGCSGSGNKPAVHPEDTTVLKTELKKEIPEEIEEEDDLDFEDMEIEEVQEILKKLMGNKNYEEAKKVAQFLLEDDSEPLKYHFDSGKIYFYLKEYDLAMNEFYHILENLEDTEDELGFEKPELNVFFKKGLEKSKELKNSLEKLEDDKEFSDLVITLLKLDPSFSFKGLKTKQGKNGNNTYFIVRALKYYQEALKEDREFWNYYKYSFLNFKMKWYSDAKKSIEKSLSLADTQAQIFFALGLQNKLQEASPNGKQSELDKLSALDLTEDMLNEFLSKYKQTLNQEQMDQVRIMMKKAMKLKGKLEKAEDDEARLALLKGFIVDSKDLLSNKGFPPDITKKIDSALKKSNKRLAELEEQIKIKKSVE
ncbi:MAG: hypothetical protein COB02_00345 [Candidatus Cloacimonadota bacterium]|nr:MAG: hypothetical protein COB02_00345 [Candidatus Cloacimonadota bacterium]